MRAELGDGYVDAVWAVRPALTAADFVMHFWDEAATRLTAKMPKGKTNPLRRFGFITTNSITQTFSRRVIERHMAAKEPLSLVYAVPDHPWLKSPDKAAVRIAMTVGAKGIMPGVLAVALNEEELNTDTPHVDLNNFQERIESDLAIGTQYSVLAALASNWNVAFRGITVGGNGFVIDHLSETNGFDAMSKSIVRPIMNGRDYTSRPSGRWVIDATSIQTEYQLLKLAPGAFQRLKDTVFLERRTNNRETYRRYWWHFMEPRREFREASEHLQNFVVTPMTARHRFFLLENTRVLADQGLVSIASSSTSRSCPLAWCN
jgi:hypothetical protein